MKGLGPLVFDGGPSLIIYDNPMLGTLADFGGSLGVLEHLTISGNVQLPDLTGLESLQEVAQDFQLTGNSALASVRGLENLTAVQYLDIEQNPQLASLAPLAAINRLTSLTAINNRRLPTCEIRALFQRAGGQDLFVDGNNSTATCP